MHAHTPIYLVPDFKLIQMNCVCNTCKKNTVFMYI